MEKNQLGFPSFYRLKRSFGQGNVFTGVCHSVNRGGVPDQAHPPRVQTGTPPGTRQVHPPDQAGTHPGTRQVHTPGPGRYPPGPGTPPGSSRPRNTVNDRPVRILLECILVFFGF